MFNNENLPFEFILLNEMASKSKARKLFDNGLRDLLKVGTLYSLQDIHKFLFEKVYPFAGELKDKDLEKTLIEIENMPQSTFDEIVEKYIQMSIISPFEKGSEVVLRIWLDCMFKHEIYRVVDWTKINKDEYFSAMKNIDVDDTELKKLLKSALTYDIDNRKIYMSGIDQSFAFEGISIYKTEDCK